MTKRISKGISSRLVGVDMTGFEVTTYAVGKVSKVEEEFCCSVGSSQDSFGKFDGVRDKEDN